MKDRVINLPPTSFDYLLVLARHAPSVVDYQTLVSEAQGYEADTTRSSGIDQMAHPSYSSGN